MVKKNHAINQLETELLQLLRDNLYRESTLKMYAHNIAMIKEYLTIHNLDYCPEIGISFADEYSSQTGHSKWQKKNLRLVVRRLNDCYYGKGLNLMPPNERNPLPEEFEKLYHAFSEQCSANGNVPSTIKKKLYALDCFLKNLNSLGYIDFFNISQSHIIQACLMAGSETHWLVIREFLSFIANRNIISKDYSFLIPSPHKSFPLPSVYSKEEIKLARQTITDSYPDRKRDICIFDMVAQLGIRCIDVVKMNFSNIDFQHNRISFVQQKTQEPISLPLPPDLKASLNDYIKNERPASDEKIIFLRTSAPHTPLDPTAVSIMISKCLKAAGIDSKGRKKGAHSFRASLATSMVNTGATYEETRRVLGHKEKNAIKHYSVLDIENLRKCALAVPEPTGFFKKFLDGEVTI